MTLTWPRALGLLAAIVGVALLVAASGVAPIAASSGHWDITAWFLHFGMRRAVSTQSMGIEAPPLEDPALVRQGAGHYEGGCRPCHGAPGEAPPVVPARMTPPPPTLPERVGDWEDRQLFWIVKHGIKFTGMPAWPSQHRDDEVWAMIAFLRTLPELDEAGYAELAGLTRLEEVELPAAAQSCVRCHGADGLGRGDAFPRLAGQSELYLQATLNAYARGDRHSGVMQPVAAALDEQGRAELARYYAGLTPGEPFDTASDLARRGERIAREGIPERRIGSCADCHGPDEGPVPHNPRYPELAGQVPAYLEQQLRLFQQGQRGGTDRSHLMRVVLAHRLEPDDIRAVAAFYASLPLGGRQARSTGLPPSNGRVSPSP